MLHDYAVLYFILSNYPTFNGAEINGIVFFIILDEAIKLLSQ